MTVQIIIKTIMYFLVFMAGASMGSFYGVVIDRLPEDRRISGLSRSECDCCHTTLKAYELIPVFSYILLGGKCRNCGTGISPRYFFGELFMGLLFLLAFIFVGKNELTLNMAIILVLWSMLYVVAVMDYRNGIIIDEVVLAFAAAGVLLIAIREKTIPIRSILPGILAGFVLYGLIYAVTRFIIKKEGFGQGDIVFMMGIGVFFNAVQTVITGFMAFYVSIVFIVIKIIAEKGLKHHMQVPFAPSMAVAAFVMSLFGTEITEKLTGFLCI